MAGPWPLIEKISRNLAWGRTKLAKKITLLFVVVLFCLPAALWAGARVPSVGILVLPFNYYGPGDQSGISDQIREGLARRLEARGHKVILSKDRPETTEQIVDAAGNRGLKYALYGSISLVGGHISSDLRLLNAKDVSGKSEAVSAQGSPDMVTQLMNKLADGVVRVVSAPYLVNEVLVKGNRRVDKDAILRILSTKPGKFYNPDLISADIKAVYKMGYFDDVQVDVTSGPGGKKVVFMLREKPAIRDIIIKGNSAIKKDKIKEVLDLKPYTIISETALQENAEKIRGLYAGKGFVNTVVTTSVEQVSDQAADVTFDIQEGDKVQIKSITFQGNQHFDAEVLKDLMETTEKRNLWIPTFKNIKALFKGQHPVLKWDALERDLGRIAAFYHNNGYIDAKIGQPQVTRKDKWLYVVIPVQEGDCYGIGKVEIQQDYFKDTAELLSKLEITGRETFSQQILRQDILKLADVFADEGFAYADIVPRIGKDPDKKVVNITLVVNKGSKVSFGRIEITGNAKTRDKVIRRELRVLELETFSATGLRKSRQRLGRLGYFEDVNLTPVKGAQKDKMDLKVKVKERPTGTFSIGAGYSSVDKLILMGEISQRNFLGRGQTLSFKGILGSQSNRYSFSFTEPYFRDTRLTLGTDLYNWERQYNDYTKSSTGGSVRMGYPLTDDLSVFTSLRMDNTTLSDISEYASQIIKDSVDIRSTRSLSLGLSYDTRDDYYNPSRGWNNSISMEYAGGLLGGDSAYIKLQGISSYYRPIWKSLVGHARLGLGYVTEGSNGKLPVYERFFLGGIDSVRGFKYGNVSPVDPDTGERIGGEYMGYMQLEAIFPLVKDMGLNGVCFLDMGNVWDKDTGYDLGDLRKSIGTGIRWLSPMGPLRIEWGYNIDTRPGDDKSNWEFRIGGAF